MAESTIFKYEFTPIDNNTLKYHFLNAKDNELSYAEFIKLLHLGDENFLDIFKKALNEATNELSAYFWECPPVSKETTNKPFEFVVTKSDTLSYIKQDYSSFKKKITKCLNKDVCSFANLGKDATLIVPMPCHNLDYKNLSNFTMNAPKEQQINFWQEVANKLTESLEISTPKWLSTNGLGVHYLHIRIDNNPKYYSWNEYYEEKILPLYKKDCSISSMQSFNYDQQTPTKMGSKATPKVQQNIEPKIKPKSETKIEQNVKPKIEPNVELNVEAKFVSNAESKMESKVN
ncbi:toll/interleukin-1 receptor domain-containing protein [Gigaspora margarita]|uniref:Toll/interleukin-1 receptor domain-containing protein n=1 Tax=Gigaspora margarita TaxID=4874 RepID=A0A8H4AHX8_GIGMA|nr:toll/interleukin-1 receptor domain-containing protein [Gigaspora margarita]